MATLMWRILGDTWPRDWRRFCGGLTGDAAVAGPPATLSAEILATLLRRWCRPAEPPPLCCCCCHCT